MGPIQTVQEFFSWLRRRWKLIALATILGTLAGLLLAMQKERVYTANAVIQVINPVIVASDEPGAVPDIARRVQMIEQRLMSREALIELAQRHHLFDGMPISPTEQVALMRQSFSITSIAAAQQGGMRDGSLSALIVAASDDNPDIAAAIANELAESLVQQSVDARQSNAQQALDFFIAEEARLQSAIDTLENEMAAYRSANEMYMPEAVTLRREEQGRLNESLLELQGLLSAAQLELGGLDPNSQRAVTRRRVSDLNDQIAELTYQSGLLRDRIDELQAILQLAPQYEQQLIAMNRRMEQLQAQLTAASERRREAELGARIEDDQQSERFELLERALVPEYPVSTSRKKIALMGIIGGIGLGAVLAYVMEWMNPVMRTAFRMERDLQLRPVISIPYAMPLAERRRRMMIWALGGIALVVLGLVLSGVLGVF